MKTALCSRFRLSLILAVSCGQRMTETGDAVKASIGLAVLSRKPINRSGCTGFAKSYHPSQNESDAMATDGILSCKKFIKC